MPSINDVYGSGKTFQASDFPPGTQVPMVIAAAAPKQFDDGGKIEISFVGQDKLFISNKTNAGRIALEHGEDYTTWVGKTIVLHQDITDFQGKPVQCIRVVPHTHVQPQVAQQAAAPAAKTLDMPTLQAAIDKCQTPDELLALVEKGANGNHLPNNIPLFTQFVTACGMRLTAEIQAMRWLEAHTALLDQRIEWLSGSLAKQAAPAGELEL